MLSNYELQENLISYFEQAKKQSRNKYDWLISFYFGISDKV